MNPLPARVKALEDCFRAIERLRMQGVPVLNAALEVRAVGFQAEPEGEIALGVLVTPWFMNLLRLPLHDGVATLPVGESAARDIGARRFDFIGGHEAGLGGFEACSLFSPMFEFASQAAALATAVEALKELRPDHAPRPVPPALPARRGFLFGRAGGAP